VGGTLAPLTLWITILLAGLTTYGIRLSFILIHERWQFPDWFQRALAYVPAAVFFAIIIPGVFYYQDQLYISWRNPQIIPAVLAGLIAWRTRKPFLSLAIGLIAFVMLYIIL
jgi:branched-subunit amino acid transport protein